MKNEEKKAHGRLKLPDGADEMVSADYRLWIGELKKRYRATQIKAAVAVNSALIEFYWSLGKDISEKYPGKKRNAHFFENLSNDLQDGLGVVKGLSPRNLKYAFAFFSLYRQQLAADAGNRQRLVADLVRVPWGHHIVLISKCQGDSVKGLFYVRRTISNNWSRSDLEGQMAESLYERTGKAASNFDVTLSEPNGYLAREMIKSEYSFDLLQAVDENDERAIEKELVRNITRTLTELGGGFAYVGHQVRVTVGGEDFWPDLIFYHLKYRRYLVIELKAGNFKPEHIGQLGFYMVAVDRQVKHEWDGPTVGLVLCRDGNRTVVEYALSATDLPMGVGKYKLSKNAPADMPEIVLPVSRLGHVVDETIAKHNAASEPAAPRKRKTAK